MPRKASFHEDTRLSDWRIVQNLFQRVLWRSQEPERTSDCLSSFYSYVKYIMMLFDTGALSQAVRKAGTWSMHVKSSRELQSRPERISLIIIIIIITIVILLHWDKKMGKKDFGLKNCVDNCPIIENTKMTYVQIA